MIFFKTTSLSNFSSPICYKLQLLFSISCLLTSYWFQEAAVVSQMNLMHSSSRIHSTVMWFGFPLYTTCSCCADSKPRFRAGYSHDKIQLPICTLYSHNCSKCSLQRIQQAYFLVWISVWWKWCWEVLCHRGLNIERFVCFWNGREMRDTSACICTLLDLIVFLHQCLAFSVVMKLVEPGFLFTCGSQRRI